ncbi:hypothetical protein FRACYDRAFT_237026 [Fragilariopsis cylindrus CCMP1102]|uniref:Palmitoyltransferase n=1 Tax=Fragilariopsis cylindrus CCMP1102 TaxID=635003 RepID=A0A1E7FKS0_9STRA|nr:hypothetical protein FRACYDRAFT_237026 [Fragilariopsis cylindrus CCMP1102]|eukprot:OEU18746.1 hypothetical protein FRACYDRAFT_237026 [Fragilariopsis cylindrus CCMP1102]
MTIKGGESGGANLVEEAAVQTNDSDFAVGCVNVTWKDDQPSWFRRNSNNDGYGSDNGYHNNNSNRNANNQYAISAIVWGCLGVGRVGNMSILAQTTENYDEEVIDNETGQVIIRNKTRPKLLWVMGPYWTVNIFITFPLIIGVSGWICYFRVSKSHLAIIITWSIGTFLLIISLCMISCCDPGILYRHAQAPTPNNNNNNNNTDDIEAEDWRWNDQARTYRPSDAKFDSECQVVVEGFDHTCPWTGTAIGSKNMVWFKIFVSMVCIMLVYTVLLAMFSSLFNPFK